MKEGFPNRRPNTDGGADGGADGGVPRVRGEEVTVTPMCTNRKKKKNEIVLVPFIIYKLSLIALVTPPIWSLNLALGVQVSKTSNLQPRTGTDGVRRPNTRGGTRVRDLTETPP